MIDILMDSVYGATIGRRGENEHVRLLIPIKDMLDMYPDAHFGLLYKAPNTGEGYPIANFTHDENYIYWVITSTELTSVGTGYCEVTAYQGETIAKSVTYKVKILTALGSGGEAPEPWTDWEKVLNDIKAAAEEAAGKIYAMRAEAETLDDGTEATVSYADGVMHFGIPKGDKGEPGVIFTPSVDEQGIISWTNNGGLPNPSSTSIKGRQGDPGDKGDTGNGISTVVLNDDYTLTVNFTDGTSYTTSSIRGEQGDKGDPGNGVPVGGVFGQVLVKNSGDDYDTVWTDFDNLRAHFVYGFHVDANESDPYEAVSYLADAVGMTPAHMDFENNTFIWGSWRNSFIMPKPCMLKYDGTVDYYLDENDYSKKENGEASDVGNTNYAGNAMMEWGRDGRKIWYKIVPEGDGSSATVYISDYKADNDYVAWSFMNAEGTISEHFYTPIYNGFVDRANRLRSISGIAGSSICKYSAARNEIEHAERNNIDEKKQWYTETYCDWVLINLLLVLVGKSLDCQSVFGMGKTRVSSVSDIALTGILNDKGMFWGSSNASDGVKVFGMENWWGNIWRRMAGLVSNNHESRYKMTRTQTDDYNYNGSGYTSGGEMPYSDGYATKMRYNQNGIVPMAVGGTSSTYYTDSLYQGDGYGYAFFGGIVGSASGPFALTLAYPQDRTFWDVSACVSCKPY